MDAFSRKAVGWALSRNLDTRLTLTELKAPIRNRRPPAYCVHHSDRRVQYAYAVYVEALSMAGMIPSMLDRGNPCDTGMMDSFIKTLKQEKVHI